MRRPTIFVTEKHEVKEMSYCAQITQQVQEQGVQYLTIETELHCPV